MTQNDRPVFLLTNDDGIEAEGLRSLVEALFPLGRLVIVAPRQEQSGVSQAITVRDPIRVKKWPYRIDAGEVEAWSVTGTPADCVKFALYDLLDQKPTLVVSGINLGPNAAINVLYSGTVAGAVEATVSGHPAIAVSLDSWSAGSDFEPAKWAIRHLAEQAISNGIPEQVFLNVNVPAIPKGELKGFQITRQAKSRWEESFSLREDPFSRPYYWLAGYFVDLDEGTGTDIQALKNGFVAVTPTKLDMTAYEHMNRFRSWTVFASKDEQLHEIKHFEK